MSCFVVSQDHLNKIVTALVGLKFIKQDDAQQMFNDLYEVNYKSYNANYKENHDPELLAMYQSTFKLGDIYPVGSRYHGGRDVCTYSLLTKKSLDYLCEVKKLIECYLYQSCELEGYEFLECILVLSKAEKKIGDNIISRLPQYKNAQWSI